MFFAPSRKLAARRLKEGGPRVYDVRERWSLRAFDLSLRGASHLLPLRPARPFSAVTEARSILALRLDRLGDLLMTLPALKALREVMPAAHIELGVGSWNEDIAKGLPFVDKVRTIDTPWAAWGHRVSIADALKSTRGRFDLAIDFQGDVRVLMLMAYSRARLRAGYPETGGSYLLTHPIPWDESRSWYWQNMELVRTLYGNVPEGEIYPYNFVQSSDRERARELFLKAGLDEGRRPFIGIHPSAGRSIKQWEASKFAALIDHLGTKGTVILTGAVGDRDLVEHVQGLCKKPPGALVGGGTLRAFAAFVEGLDLFVTGDTGPMHLAHAVGTRNVAIFGPSDPVRYGPSAALELRRVVREPVYCSPCNMIRRPPAECSRPETPECISKVSLDQVLAACFSSLE